MKTPLKLLLILLTLNYMSCTPDVMQDDNGIDPDNTPDNVKTIEIPDGFDYKTSNQIRVKITDSDDAIYEIFTTSEDPIFVGTETFENESGETVTEEVFRDDIINKQILSGVVNNGQLNQVLTISTYTDKVYLRRRHQLKASGHFVDIVNNEINFNFQETSDKSAIKVAQKSGVIDYLFCVNGEGDLFQVDPTNGSYTFLSEMPMGSYTAAIDQENLVMYSIGRSKPNPLMKYDIQTGEWSTVANLNFGGPRLDYNINDNLLYFSNSDYIRTIDPSTGQVLNEWDVNGLHNRNGGDLKFDETNGTLYLASFSGLYRCEFNGTSYDAIRISADNLPFTPTSMTIDSNGDLWLADANTNGNLIIMDTVTGGWQYVYGANANNNTAFGRRINDLTTFRIFPDTPDTTDSDGDGIVDAEDAFPQEAEKAFEVFTPSKFGTGTIAFEDLWPSYGDYDFNDLAFNYRAIAILNSDNLAVQLDFICKIKNGAGFTNAFGIELEGISSGLVESVTGTKLTEGYINVNANGTEAEQQNAVIIFTDNQDNFANETTVSIKFTQPISTDQLGTAPFNPFIIKNGVRANEIHLPYYNTTDLGQSSIDYDGNSKDLDGNYISDAGYPWAISIVHDFKVPKEKVAIEEAYNFFVRWATSGGQEYADWYKDNPGYRNTDKIQN